ncbi:ABC transporter substrate-binding protein [Poriferisphaera corsica]|nr:extracellular solute-binding protein [Poriferisphaera corsica]
MKDHVAKFVIIGLLLIVVGVPMLLRPAKGEAGGEVVALNGAGDTKLIIMTPHNEQIRYEFATAFNQWRLKQGKETVVFDWRAGGGTSDLRKQLLTQFVDAAKDGREEMGVGVDLFFGGGEYDHNKLAKGIKFKRDGEERKLSVSVPAGLNEAVIEDAFPGQMIGGSKLYRDDLLWVGTALSSFGIVYNRDVVEMLGVKEPKTWLDMTQPEFRDWAALADPSHSGSIAATYNVILMRKGWEDGWSLLRRAFANARYFASSSSKVPVDVSSGEAGLGMCIDFYGRFQAAVTDDVRVGYVDPAYMTAITPDPISVIRGAPHKAIAKEFIEWLLTKDAQGLWQKRIGTAGGPLASELRRQPIRRDMFTIDGKVDWADRELDPFSVAKPFVDGVPDYFGFVALVSHAMAIDIHEELKAAWAVINRVEDGNPVKGEMLRLFDAMPKELVVDWPSDELRDQWLLILEDEDDLRRDEVLGVLDGFVKGLKGRYKKNPDLKLQDRLAWTLFFRENYRRIVELEKQVELRRIAVAE